MINTTNPALHIDLLEALEKHSAEIHTCMGVHNHATAPPQCDISMTGKDTDTDITPPQRPHAQPTGVFKSGR